MISQYRKIKDENLDHLLFYRMGDFYELFFDDAIKGADLLNITLTKRGSSNGEPIPMAGIPHHSASGYFQRLVDRGITFAICEQVGVVQKNSKDPVAREVTQIVTPGTVLDEDFMQDQKSHALMSIYLVGNCIAVAILNLGKSTIEYTECQTIEDISRLITLYDPSEILISEKQIQTFKAIANLTIRPDWDYYQQANHKLICDYFNMNNLNAFSCEDKPNIISTIGSIFNYLSFTRQGKTNQIKNIVEVVQKDIIKLDQATLKHMVYGN
ncbi:MAG: DNA mismatch repair protein MutS, partial [Gammaproteobacteria bacterium]|nr:DNA mismatch repair protein MutS [Gammaproteobacteria bacterium]